jgi:hypothetical protein
MQPLDAYRAAGRRVGHALFAKRHGCSGLMPWIVANNAATVACAMAAAIERMRSTGAGDDQVTAWSDGVEEALAIDGPELDRWREGEMVRRCLDSMHGGRSERS